MPNKEITIEELAEMIQRGFNNLEGKIEGTAKKEDVDSQFEEVFRKFMEVDGKLENLGSRLSNIENRLEEMQRILLLEHSRRIKELEEKMEKLSS